MSALRRLTTWPILLLASAVLARALSSLLPLLLRQDHFAGDAAQHTWWMYRFADPTLFPNSLAADYFSQFFLSPAGYQLAIGTLCRFLDAQRVTEVLAIVLAVTAIVLAAAVGDRIGRRIGAAVALVVLGANHLELLVEGGFARSFGVVLLLAGMLCLLRRNWIATGGVVLASAAFYPPIVLTLAAPVAGVIGLGVWRERKLPRGFWWLVGLSAVAAGVLAASYLRPLPPEIGRPFKYAEMITMQEWQRGGRFRFFDKSPWVYYFHGTNSGLGYTVGRIAVASAVLLAAAVFIRRAVPLEAWALLAGCLTLWAAAHAFLFKLYFPDRYPMYGFPVFAVMAAAGIARELWPCCRRLAVRRVATGVVIAFTFFTVATSVRAGMIAYREPGKWLSADGYDAALAYLAKRPVRVQIASHPDDANAIPLRIRRNVLVNTESTLPIHDRYYAEMRRRTNDVFDLMYATDWPSIDRIARRDKIDYFLLDTRRLNDPDARPYLRPFLQGNRERIATGRKQGFALLSPPANRVAFTRGDVVVLRLNRGRP